LTNDPSLLESETDRTLGQSTLQQTAQSRQRLLHSNNDSAIAQREREIEDIAKGIIDLANIFQELNTMVIDQGSMLDRIDYNVERTAEDVKGADKELVIASGYQKRSIKRKIMLLLIIVIAGMIILLGLKLGTRGDGSDSGNSGSQSPKEPELMPPQHEPAGDGGQGISNMLFSKSAYAERSKISMRTRQPRSRKDWHRRKRRIRLIEQEVAAVL
jgi:syntaxin 16